MNFQHTWQSPVGPLQLRMQEDRLSGIYFEDHHPEPRPSDGVTDAAPFQSVVSQLEEYFCGDRREFTVPLAVFVGTEFPAASVALFASNSLGRNHNLPRHR